MVQMSPFGTLRHFAAMQWLARSWSNSRHRSALPYRGGRR